MSQKLEELLETLEAAARRKQFCTIDFFEPYEKQQAFFDLGLTKRERLLMAGNQEGKTHAGAAETTYHMTGEYPDWWMGRRFDHPTTGWIVGETSLAVRDIQQKKLCGKPGVDAEFGTGMIPKDRFADKPSMARGITDAFDMIQVEHRTNGVVDGISVANFKSYEQGRTKFQGGTLDWIWDDEEPPDDVYSEEIARITATKGMIYTTFTPLKGMSEVVCRFLNEASPDRAVVTMTLEDAKHISPDERATIIAGYKAHEREARVNGVPMLGSGAIYQFSDEAIMEPAILHMPMHWVKLWGVDFGIDHPFAAVLIAWDRDNDVIHVLHCFKIEDQLPIQHAVPMKQIGAAVPVAWPQDGTQRDKGSGEQLSKLYKKEGLLMLAEHATWPDGGVSTEAGILEIQERMASGRFKVASHLSQWFEEKRLYHRKDGQIVKVRDDILSGTRVAVMMKRFARAVPLGRKPLRRPPPGALADGVDFELFA